MGLELNDLGFKTRVLLARFYGKCLLKVTNYKISIQKLDPVYLFQSVSLQPGLSSTCPLDRAFRFYYQSPTVIVMN